ncbi:MAG: MoaD family protein [Candidatus Odinarchaeota archaeon]
MESFTTKVKIRFNAIFREITGKKEIIEEISKDCDIACILERLAERYGKEFATVIDPETGKIAYDVLVSLNGSSIRDTNTDLKDGDILIIAVAVGGG